MSFREVCVIEIREVLRLWLQRDTVMRPIAELAGVDRKTTPAATSLPRSGWG